MVHAITTRPGCYGHVAIVAHVHLPPGHGPSQWKTPTLLEDMLS